MMVVWKGSSDPQRLKEFVAGTDNAKQRDRYRVVLLAGEGSASHGQLTRDRSPSGWAAHGSLSISGWAGIAGTVCPD
jgi:hypothetical protein